NLSILLNTCVPPTPTPTSTSTSTPTSTPTATPTVNAACICSLSVPTVTIACTGSNTVHWTSTVNNRGTCSTYDGWTAELQVKMRANGQFQTVATRTGYTLFPPGNTQVNLAGSYDFCYQFAPGTNSIRVAFTLSSSNRQCSPQNKSGGMAPCPRTAACP